MSRPTLLLLPGLMCDRAVWAPQIDALAARAQCVVPHYGTLDSLTAMAEKVLAEAPTERFALAGHSMGGRVAFEIWRQAPQRVERLALLDTSYHPLAPGDEGQRERAGRLALLELARRQGMRDMARHWAMGMVHPDRHGTPLFEQVLDMIERSTPEVFAAQINALLLRADAQPLLPTIQVPTLLLCGREDGWSPPLRHEHMQAAIPGSRLVVVEHCGHMSTMERPTEVSTALAAWLTA
jgi:pimeloyl-ACP methyl ester carboxylesterase